jgi:5,10-methylenetetrahydromethanopterin reductase
MTGLTSELPRIGIRLSGGLEPRRCVELAKVAETADLASVWFAENPFQRGVLATAGACAAASSRVRIGIGVVNPFSRHPSLIAMEFSALAELAAGRITLGLGSGVGEAMRRIGYGHHRPVTAVREAVGIIRAMLAGDKVTHRGHVFSVFRAQLGHRSPEVPIYMAAAGERGLKACGEIGDGLIVSNLTPPRSTARMAAILGAAAARVGRPLPGIVQYVPCAVRTDGAAARAVVKAAIGAMLTRFWPDGNDWPAAKEAIVSESGIPRSHFAAVLAWLRRGEDAATLLDDGFVEAFAIAGTAQECLRKAERYRAAGADELALTFAGAQPEEDIAYLGSALSRVEP